MSTSSSSVEPSSLGRVAVVAGGLSHERDVSLKSGRRLLHDLQTLGVDVGIYDADQNLMGRLADDHVEVVFPTLHGESGEDGSVQTVLELAGVPFVGSPSRSCRLGWDKSVARVLFERAGLPVPHSAALPVASFRELGSAVLITELVERIGLPMVLKPSRGGSALGVSGVTELEDLPSALVGCFAYGDVALVERYVEGLDVSVGVVETARAVRALPPVAVTYSQDHQFDFAARYSPELMQVDAPAVLSEAVLAELQRVAVAAHQELGLRHWSRADFLVEADGSFVLLESAITPGLTETSLFPFALQASGTTLGRTALELLADARASGPA